MKQELFDCLRKKSFVFHVSDSKASSKLFMKCVELIFGWPHAPRRYLATKLHKSMAPSPTPDLAPTPSASSPAPSAQAPSNSPSPSPSPVPQAPVEPPVEPVVLTGTSNVRPPLPPRKHSLPAPHPPPPNNDDNNQAKTIVIAAAAAGAFAVIALLLCCCLKRRSKEVDPAFGRKDDRPLLHMSLSDFSAGILLLGFVFDSFQFLRHLLTII